MGYLFSSVFRLFAVLVVLAGISQVPRVDGRAAVTSGEQEDAEYRLTAQIFSLDEKKESLSTLNQFELNEIYQEYSLQENCAKPRDCAAVKCCGAWRSGVYKIYPFGIGTGYYAYCYLTEDQDGWTVIQRRQDGSVDFNRNWADYERGFGQLNGEFWLGLTKVHGLLSQRPHELLVKMRDFAGGSAYAKYDWFFVSGPADKYRLQVGHYIGTAGDALAYHNGMQFSTKDRDNDRITGNCALDNEGGGWHKICHHSHLNGAYCGIALKDAKKNKCITWFKWRNNLKPLQYAEMMIRPTGNCNPAEYYSKS